MNAAWLIAAWFSTIFQCIPVEAAWMTIKGSHCFSQTQWFLGTAIPSMIIDACILIMPLPMLWGLKASKSRRALVTGIFICGYRYFDFYSTTKISLPIFTIVSLSSLLVA